jgi:hemerythrin-like domain-containing protein
MTARKDLEHEHGTILLVLRAAEREAANIADTGSVHPDRTQKMVEFFREFADRCHHAKEEKWLFPLVRDRGTDADARAVEGLLAEHQEARRCVRQISEGLTRMKAHQASGAGLVEENLSAYVALMRVHIRKENTEFFPRAEELLTETDQATLAEAYRGIETKEMGEGTHEKYVELAQTLAESWKGAARAAAV